MSIVEYPTPLTGDAWTREWEQATITRLAWEVGREIPENPVQTRPPAPGEESQDYYDTYSSVAGLDQFIFQSCAAGVALTDDTEFQLLLTRQIGDDGAHAQRYREVVAKATGRDPLRDIERAAREQRELVGDLTSQGLAGFVVFEISYELYTAPEFLVLGRTARISDPDLLVSGAERFGPDEAVHRQGVANWFRDHLRSLPSAVAQELIAEVKRLDDDLWERRSSDIDRRWIRSQLATGSDYGLIRAVRKSWRDEVQRFLFSPVPSGSTESEEAP